MTSPNSSAKALLHEMYTNWSVRNNGNTDWSQFISANYQEVRDVVKMATNSNSSIRTGRTRDSNIVALATTESGILQALVELDMLSGAEKALAARMKLITETRKNERELAKESVDIAAIFLTEETRKTLAVSINANVDVLSKALLRLKKQFNRSYEMEDEIQEHIDTLQGHVLRNQDDEETSDQLGRLEKELGRISRQRERVLAQQDILSNQLLTALQSFKQLHDIVIELNIQGYNHANHLAENGDGKLLTRDYRQATTQMGVPLDVAARYETMIVQSKAVDAQIARGDQTDALEGLMGRLQTLKQAVEDSQKEHYEMEEVNFDDEPLDPSAITIDVNE